MTAPTGSHATQRSDPRRLLLGLGLLPLGGMLMLGLGIALGVRGDKIWMLGLAAVTTVLLAVPAMLDQARPAERRHLLFSLLCLVYLMGFVLPVFTRYLVVDSQLREMLVGVGYVGFDDLIRGQLAALVGAIALLAGYAVPVGRRLAELAPRSRYEWSSGAALALACIGIPLGWATTLGAEMRVLKAGIGMGFLSIFMHFTLYGLALLALTYLRHRSRLALVLLIILIPVTMGFNFFTGSKGRFFGPLIMVFLAYLFYERRIRTSWVVAGLALVVVFYPASEFYRNVLTRSQTVRVLDMIKDPGMVFRQMSDFASGHEAEEWVEQGLGSTAARFDSLAILSLIVRTTPEEVPYQGGWTLGYAFLSFIPRIVWADKPVMTTGRWVAGTYTLAAGTETSIGSSWPGEFYLNFGWLGIGFGMIAVGILFRTIHEFLFRLGGTIPLLLAAVMLMNYCVRTLEGDLLTLLAGVVFTALPVMVMHVSVRFAGAALPLDRVREASGPARSLPAAPAARGRLSSP